MRNHSRSYVIGGLLLAAGATGVAMMCTSLIGKDTRNISAKDRATALEVWNGAIVSPAQAKGRAALPAAGSVPSAPVTTSQAAQAPAPAGDAAPCPSRIEITSGGPNSSTNYHCSSTSATTAGGTASVSVSSNSSQSSSGARNTSTSSTVITITND